ncbi:septum formation family protein [Jatrophihabitans cynanchi]|jgi:hypothetical protein|uniref:Septum formation family protein n=1 Tax=Jatrophihabitans cynanchi TaxID=2944128 RepID=A0ABY7K0N2_9ACTN|nr:septum formation family protein [Jatrophihabitans sp. SB3-54]WAX57740.1 septum formation family protein [Jatrophihabitans sp. SB3-54]
MRLPKAPLAAVLLLGCVAGCTSSGSGSHKVSVFAVKPGQCFTAPGTVKVQLSSLAEVDCSKPHTQEAYAVVPYTATGGAASTGTPAARALTSSYPGEDVLTTFAQGACAQRYRGYVGVDYLDSTLFFTYLLPSARSWEQQADRNVLCFVTTTGTMLTKSVKGSKQ